MQPTLKKQLCGSDFFFWLITQGRNRDEAVAAWSVNWIFPATHCATRLFCTPVLYNSTAVNPTLYELFIIQFFFPLISFHSHLQAGGLCCIDYISYSTTLTWSCTCLLMWRGTSCIILYVLRVRHISTYWGYPISAGGNMNLATFTIQPAATFIYHAPHWCAVLGKLLCKCNL